MKVFPIKVEKTNKQNYKFIEWKIHNVCNYNCSFCAPMHKNGSQRWFDLDFYKTNVDKLYDLCDGSPFWFQLTGGEPTLYPKLIELCQYIKSKNGLVSLISNGSRTLRWWQELKNSNTIDHLIISLHTEQTKNYKHISDVLNLFHDVPINIICLITHTKDTIDLAFEAKDFLKNTTGSIIVVKAMMITNYDIYEMYTPEQLYKLKEDTFVLGIKNNTKTKSFIPKELSINFQLKVTFSNNLISNIDPQILMKNKMNKFLDWQCEIGKDNMRIDYDIVYRGVCEVGGSRSLNDPQLQFTDDFIKCTSNNCLCATDMISTKYLLLENNLKA